MQNKLELNTCESVEQKPDLPNKMPLFNKTFAYSLFTVAAPITCQNFINSAVNMADAVMIGRLGKESIAAVGLANQIFFILNLLLFGLLSGSAVFSSQFWGKKDVNGIRRTTGLCLIIATVIAGFFTFTCAFFPKSLLAIYSNDAKVIELGSQYLSIVCLCFFPFAYSFSLTMILRSIGKIKLAVITTALSLILNISLNLVLIFGLCGFPAYGVQGAAIATVSSRILELTIVLTVSISKKYPVIGNFQTMFTIPFKFLKSYFLIASPVVMEEILWSLGITMHNLIFSRLGTSEYAAFNIIGNVSLLLWVLFIGVGNGSAVVIGNNIGKGNIDEAKSFAFFISILTPLMAIAVSLLFIPISWLVPLIFDVGSDVLNIVPSLLMVLALFYPAKAFNVVMIVGVCRGGGDTRFSLFYDVLFMWIFAIPLAYAISLSSNFAIPYLVYACILSEEAIKLVLGAKRLKSGKWLHCVV